MVTMYARHTVADFNKWKNVFEETRPLLKKSSSTAAHVFNNHANPNDVLVITEWNNKEQAMKFGESPELKSAMERSGVTSAPEMTFAE
ncbi:MAG: cyclase [Bacteroidia bacterium]|nr:cyclase [Bacteroidia bacterium]